jgi:hypothetical protein
MRRRILLDCFLLALLGGIFPGCRSASSQRPYPEDPVLVSKRPVPGGTASDRPVLLAYAEPVPPPLPAEAFVAASPTLKALPRTAESTTTAKTSPPESPGVAVGLLPDPPSAQPAPPEDSPASVRVVPVSRRKRSGAYGHAPDHSWLQGIFDRLADGRLELRYTRPAEDEPWSGKVNLVDDPRFAQLRPGDVIRIEGELVDRAGSPARDQTPPTYRAGAIWLIQRRD